MAIRKEVYWYTLRTPTVQPLTKDITADVVIVGGGMAGLTVAQTLADKGLSVALCEQTFCGGGASGRSSGFITPDSEMELTDLVRAFGPAQAQRLWDFVTGGVEHIRQTIKQYNLDCDYQEQASFFTASSRRGFSIVKEEHEVRSNLQYESALFDRVTTPQLIGSDQYYGGVKYGGTFGISSYQYCQQLKDRLVSQGVHIYEQTPVTAVTEDHVVTETGYTVRAQSIVICADYLAAQLGLLAHTVYHAQTFLGITAPLSAADRDRLFPAGPLMVWDTNLIYQYFRLTGDNRLLIGTASLFYTYWPQALMPTRGIIRKAHRYLRKKFPWLKTELEYMWPGLIGVSADFVPLAGNHKQWKNVYYVSAAAGLPWAAALGRATARQITGKTPELADAFSLTRRFPLPRIVQRALPRPLGFALSHGLVKYFK